VKHEPSHVPRVPADMAAVVLTQPRLLRTRDVACQPLEVRHVAAPRPLSVHSTKRAPLSSGSKQMPKSLIADAQVGEPQVTSDPNSALTTPEDAGDDLKIRWEAVDKALSDAMAVLQRTSLSEHRGHTCSMPALHTSSADDPLVISRRRGSASQMVPIDWETEVPEDLFQWMLVEGKKAQERGQHRLRWSSDKRQHLVLSRCQTPSPKERPCPERLPARPSRSSQKENIVPARFVSPSPDPGRQFQGLRGRARSEQTFEERTLDISRSVGPAVASRGNCMFPTKRSESPASKQSLTPPVSNFQPCELVPRPQWTPPPRFRAETLAASSATPMRRSASKSLSSSGPVIFSPPEYVPMARLTPPRPAERRSSGTPEKPRNGGVLGFPHQSTAPAIEAAGSFGVPESVKIRSRSLLAGSEGDLVVVSTRLVSRHCTPLQKPHAGGGVHHESSRRQSCDRDHAIPNWCNCRPNHLSSFDACGALGPVTLRAY